MVHLLVALSRPSKREVFRVLFEFSCNVPVIECGLVLPRQISLDGVVFGITEVFIEEVLWMLLSCHTLVSLKITLARETPTKMS